MSMRPFPLFLLACASTLSLTPPAPAVITANTPLKQVIDGGQLIFVAKVAEVLPDKPALVLARAETLKGEPPFERLPINLTGDDEAAKGKHTQVILDRVEKDLPIVVIANRRGKKYTAFGFTNGTWFQMEGRVESQEGKEVVRWSFLHAEPYLRRTFKGTTAELQKIITDSVKNKKDPPEPDEKEKPGFGEPVKKTSGLGSRVLGLVKNDSRSSNTYDHAGERAANTSSHPIPETRDPIPNLPLAVIQLPFIGLIAGLAALFPTVFGGLALLMRRWMALLSVASFASIIYFLHTSFPKWIRWTGIDSMATLWLACAALGGLGALWSARRYRKAIAAGKTDDWQPRKLDRIGLAVLTLMGIGALIYALVAKEPLRYSPWPEILICLTGAAAGTYFVFRHYFRARRLEPRPTLSVSAETVMLWAAVFAAAYVGALETGRADTKQTGVKAGDARALESNELSRKPTIQNGDKPKWVFQPKENGQIFGTPCRTPDHVVVSVFHNEGVSQYGCVYALDPETGTEKWRFSEYVDPDDKKEKEMLPVFCSPVYADGMIYVGEGFHKNQNCRLFCLDAANGKLLWSKKTNSHTESTPAVAEGMVAFGAGNDGLYVLNAKTGDELFHFAGESGLHIDSNPAIAGGLVYASSGFSNTHQVNRIFCVDPKAQKEVWGERVEFSAYGSPAVADGRVYFTTGNSTYSEHRNPPAGQVLCRDAKTGAVIWDRALPETAICKPAVDRQYVYVGCWDGNCYALKAADGKDAWEKPQPMGNRVVAAPVLDRCPICLTTEVVYVVGQEGVIKALSPQTGADFWTLDLRASNPDLPKIDLDGAPLVERLPPQGTLARRRVYLPAGLAASGVALPVARLYCYEDATDHGKP
jgi:outer membrane protein assembly factor BamB